MWSLSKEKLRPEHQKLLSPRKDPRETGAPKGNVSSGWMARYTEIGLRTLENLSTREWAMLTSAPLLRAALKVLR